MKKRILISLMLIVSFSSYTQEIIAKFKYEDAEKEFYEKKYEDCISLLDEAEKILGQTAPHILHLKTLAQYKLFEQNPNKSFEALESLRNNCYTYLTKYDIEGLEEKYRDVYEIQHKLPKVSNQTELTQLCEQQKKERQDRQKEVALIDNNLILVEGGTYIMGNGKDAREVTLSDFYIGKYEISNKEWNNYLKSTGKKVHDLKLEAEDEAIWSYVRTDYRDDRTDIWESYMAYCKWLESQYGGTWRLPTEAEWEYAARGGNKSQGYKYSGSNNWKEVTQIVKSDYRPRGKFKPNELGIYDMTGNVYEVCYDYWSREHDSESSSDNPMGPTEGKSRVVRGGGGKYASITVYDNSGHTGRLGFIDKAGFRVVYIPDN